VLLHDVCLFFDISILQGTGAMQVGSDAGTARDGMAFLPDDLWQFLPLSVHIPMFPKICVPEFNVLCGNEAHAPFVKKWCPKEK
jgi:hypothetical protein